MSFSTSLSGLFANQQKLNVIGNNLANINTLAFKSSRVEFADLVSQSIGGSSANPMQIGLGVTTGSISPNFTQGGIETTGVATNAAIQGSGFFVIGTTSERAYTRAGDFSFDANGLLVTADGTPVQGYTAIDPVTHAITTTGQPGNITVPPGVLRPPVVTTQFATFGNLDANAAIGAQAAVSVQLYDVLGKSHDATVTYTKNTAAGIPPALPASSWDFKITVPVADITGPVVDPTNAAAAIIATGTVRFGPTGTLIGVTAAAGGAPAPVIPPVGTGGGVTITAPLWSNGAAAPGAAAVKAVTWNLWDPSGIASLTGYASPSATSSVTQNGAAPGTVSGISINSAGEIVATFGAGKTVAVGQLAIANFNDPQGLLKLGQNAFSETSASGLPNVGIAGTGGRGDLIGSSLEQSNVDIAQEFTQMILAQRGYEANGKSITTADEILQDTLALKR